jgi:hypothetical protein
LTKGSIILDAITKLYLEGPKFLYDVAIEYRAKRDSFQKVFSKGSPPIGWENDINIIIDLFSSSTTRVPSTRSFSLKTALRTDKNSLLKKLE